MFLNLCFETIFCFLARFHISNKKGTICDLKDSHYNYSSHKITKNYEIIKNIKSENPVYVEGFADKQKESRRVKK